MYRKITISRREIAEGQEYSESFTDDELTALVSFDISQPLSKDGSLVQTRVVRIRTANISIGDNVTIDDVIYKVIATNPAGNGMTEGVATDGNIQE